MSDKTISFDVEDLSVGVRGARSQVEDFLASKARRAMDVSVEALKSQIQNTLGAFMEMMNEMDLDEKRFCVGSVSLTLSINAEGKVSVFSISSGAVGSQAGITFTLTRTRGSSDGPDNRAS